MPTPRVTMSKLRHTLQLLHGGALSTRQIGAALGISKSTVSEIASYARVAGVDWALAQSLNDEELQARLYKPAVARESRHLEPDHAHIHRELCRPGVTLQLLWEEYQQQHSGQAYKYSAFCEKYKAWARRLQRSMRQTHTGGDKLFVDYAGQTVPVVDADTGEIRPAQVFVAVLGASNYTYACATASQKATDWAASIIATLEFIGGVPRLLVPDQPRALMARPDRYEPTAHRLLEELSAHYSLAELNRAIAALLVDLNQRAFKKLPGNRTSAFAELDRPALRPLPPVRMPIARFKPARVNIDYHVELDGHYYSVPHALVGEPVELRITAGTVEVLHGGKRVAAHALNPRRGSHTTTPEHMPASHWAHLQWTPAKLIAWGERVGAATASVVRWQMEHRQHPEQGYRSCLGLMRLGREYGADRLEAACARAQSIRSPSYKSIASILGCGLDQRPLDAPMAAQASLPLHENVRGPGYYH
ncbi:MULTISPECIES: IS21 family transposase [Comamonadaceae]|uniref:IS21 family transposase n=1 Tax=Comamonadaceae TaxID=80864 RepID=UPI001A93C78D|nr:MULTISPECIES: IS21 family transposase [Acidovorax]MBO0944191.1 IS21 family transposase [Acidovorax temperans]MBP3982312.1 IS21 family transposase [Acidovorax sp. JG5]WCT24939.1 IS21 family transposase [Acidovorax temperans]